MWTQITVADPGEGPPPRLTFLDQTEGREIFLRHLPPAYLRVWMTAPPPLSEGQDPPLNKSSASENRGKPHVVFLHFAQQ